jgi:DNA-binding NarL/FixJ family response regulator
MSECSDLSHSRPFATKALWGARIATVVDPASSIPGWLEAVGVEHIALWADRNRLTEAVALAATHAHAAVIDLDQGIDRAFRLARTLSPSCGVLFIAASIDAATCRQIDQAHWGFRTKDASQGDVLLALRRLVRLCIPDIARLAAHGAQLWRLSPQQAWLLYFNLWCYCDRDIADALSVSVHTVQEYQEDLRKKTGARNKQAYFARLVEVSDASTVKSRRVRTAPGRATAGATIDRERNVLFERRALHG